MGKKGNGSDLHLEPGLKKKKLGITALEKRLMLIHPTESRPNLSAYYESRPLLRPSSHLKILKAAQAGGTIIPPIIPKAISLNF